MTLYAIDISKTQIAKIISNLTKPSSYYITERTLSNTIRDAIIHEYTNELVIVDTQGITYGSTTYDLFSNYTNSIV